MLLVLSCFSKHHDRLGPSKLKLAGLEGVGFAFRPGCSAESPWKSTQVVTVLSKQTNIAVAVLAARPS